MSKKLKTYAVLFRVSCLSDTMVREVKALSKCDAAIKVVNKYIVHTIVHVRKVT